MQALRLLWQGVYLARCHEPHLLLLNIGDTTRGDINRSCTTCRSQLHDTEATFTRGVPQHAEEEHTMDLCHMKIDHPRTFQPEVSQHASNSGAANGGYRG